VGGHVFATVEAGKSSALRAAHARTVGRAARLRARCAYEAAALTALQQEGAAPNVAFSGANVKRVARRD